MNRLNQHVAPIAVSALAVCFLSACASNPATTQPSSDYDRGQAAMKDPFHYSPDFQNTDTDISGGGISNFDRDGMRRDVNNVLNP